MNGVAAEIAEEIGVFFEDEDFDAGASEEEAKRFASSANNSTFAEFRPFIRAKTVYLRVRNEEDDKERAHIKKLREMAKQKKQGN